MATDFDVFLSHNSGDKPAVRKLGELLKKRNLQVWLDEWELIPGRKFQQDLEDLIEQIRSVAVLIGDKGLGPWQEAEMRAFLDESMSRGIPIIPVLLPGAPIDVRLPLFLRAYTWVDCRDGFSTAMIDRLVWGVTGDKPKTAKRTTPDVSRKVVSLRVSSKILKRGKRIPYRVFRRGGNKHYNVRIFIEATSSILDSIIEVEYQLHSTFKQPRRVSSDRGKQFSFDIWTYSGFDVHAMIHFEDRSVSETSHTIELELPDDDGTNYVNESKNVR